MHKDLTCFLSGLFMYTLVISLSPSKGSFIKKLSTVL